MALALLSGTSQPYQVTWEVPSSHKWECFPKIHILPLGNSVRRSILSAALLWALCHQPYTFDSVSRVIYWLENLQGQEEIRS